MYFTRIYFFISNGPHNLIFNTISPPKRLINRHKPEGGIFCIGWRLLSDEYIREGSTSMEWYANRLCLVLGTCFSTPETAGRIINTERLPKLPKHKPKDNLSHIKKITNHLTLYRNMSIFVTDQISAIDPKLVTRVWTGGCVLNVMVLTHNLAILVQVLLILCCLKHTLLIQGDVDVWSQMLLVLVLI